MSFFYFQKKKESNHSCVLLLIEYKSANGLQTFYKNNMCDENLFFEL